MSTESGGFRGWVASVLMCLQTGMLAFYREDFVKQHFRHIMVCRGLHEVRMKKLHTKEARSLTRDHLKEEFILGLSFTSVQC